MRRRDFLRTASGLLVPAWAARGQILGPIVSGGAGTPAPAMPRTDLLVAEYDFRPTPDATKVYDRSGNNYHCTLSGSPAPTFSAEGLPLAGASAQYIQNSADAAMWPNVFTVSLIARWTASVMQTLVGFAGSNNPTLLSHTTNLLRIFASSTNYRSWTGPSDGAYHFVAFVLPGAAQADIASAYCALDAADGNVTATVQTGQQGTKTMFRLGSGGGYSMTGAWAYFAMHGGVLTPAEIQQVRSYMLTKIKDRPITIADIVAPTGPDWYVSA